MLEVTMNCHQCSRTKRVLVKGDEKLPIDALGFIQYVAAAKDLGGSRRKWVVQKNGEWIDTYCSKSAQYD